VIPVPARAKKKLGQNFLVDENVRHKLVDFIKPAPQDDFLEIGAGTGALTRDLAPHVKHLIAVELDQSLLPYLAEIEGVEVLHADILKIAICELRASTKLRVAGNLPYYISSPILISLLAQRECIIDMTLLFQEEVAQRITAASSTPEYGYLSVVSQYFSEIMRGFKIGRNSFSPRPDVDSRVLSFKPKQLTRFDYSTFAGFVQNAFSQRRKMLRNNLMRTMNIRSGDIEHAFSYLKIRPDVRAENLSPQQFEQLLLLLRS